MGIDWFLKLSNDNAELRQLNAELQQWREEAVKYLKRMTFNNKREAALV